MTRDFAVPADPAERPLRRRATVRVLVFDESSRVLLLCDSDPGTGARWWITPGGGIEGDESLVDAVRRELEEETGLRVSADQVLGPIASRRVWHGYSDVVVDQHDTFFAVRVPAFEIDPGGLTEEERITLQGSRWWTRDDLAASAEPAWPVRMGDLLDLVGEPAAWPVELATVEESSVPVKPASSTS